MINIIASIILCAIAATALLFLLWFLFILIITWLGNDGIYYILIAGYLAFIFTITLAIYKLLQ